MLPDLTGGIFTYNKHDLVACQIVIRKPQLKNCGK